MIAIVVCWPGKALAEWTEWLADAELSYTFQDNINHAMFDSAEQSDQIWSSNILLGRVYQMGNKTRLFASAQIQGKVHQDFSHLNQTIPAVNFAIRHKFGVGPYQPWVSASVTTAYLFSKSKIREGYLTTAGFDIGKALHQRFDVVLNYRFDYRDSHNAQTVNANKLVNAGLKPGKSNNVFDIEGHSVGIQLNTLVTQQWVLLLAYNFRTGDIVSSNSPSLVPRINSIVDAIAIEDALPGWVYRSNGETHRYSVDANYAFLKGHAAFNLGYEYIESHANSFSYKNNLLRVNFNYSF